MNARGAAGRCPPTTWLGPWLLLLCLLVSGSITMEVPPQYCSEMITDRHLKMLQDLIDSQMETSCQIAFEFVDQEQLKDPVCYLKKAFFLVEDIIEDTLRFKHNTANADTIEQLRELSVSLKRGHCFTKDYDEHDKACIRTFSETPLQLLEKIKSIFNETKNFLKKDWKIFSKNCNDSFAKCSSQDVVTKPDCNCLYPKAIPSSDLASVSPQQPLTRSKVPMAGLTWSDSEGTEGSSLLPGEQPQAVPSSNHPGSAKQRPPRSTCQSFETLETPGVEGSPTEDSAQPHPSAGARLPGVDDVLDSVLGTDWALEEASGEASEELVPQGAELSSSSLGGSSVQAEMASPSDLLPASSPLPQLAEGRQPADETVTSLPKMGPGTPTGQAQNHTPEKTDRSSALPRDHQDSARTPSLRPQGLSSPSTLSAQPQLPRSHSWGSMLPLGELEGKRSTRERRSPAELEGGQASDRAARPPAHFNPVPLTDAGHDRQRVEASDLQPSGFVFPLSSIILVLLAVGGLLLYRRKRRSHREPHTVDSPMEQPEGSPLTPDEDRQVELPV